MVFNDIQLLLGNVCARPSEDRLTRFTSKSGPWDPVYEPIVPSATECFVWRTDDYPLSWSVWNSHPECEIHLIRNAGGTCHIGDHIASFAPGDLFLVGRGLPHNWVTPLRPGERVADRDVILQFDEDRILETSIALPEISGLKALLTLARRGIVFHGQTRDRGAYFMEKIGYATGLERLSLFFALLHILSTSSEHKLLSSTGFAAQARLATNGIIREVLTWMASNYHTDVRLAQAAAAAGMAQTSFSRFFKRNTGTTFSHYLSELRIAKACELLLRTELPVTVISSEVGYDNLSNFNRTFKNSRGTTPGVYRRTARAKGLMPTPTVPR